MGERVLVLLLIPQHSLHCSPYAVTRKVGELDYVIAMPHRYKAQRLYHVNMLQKHGKKLIALGHCLVVQNVSERWSKRMH